MNGWTDVTHFYSPPTKFRGGQYDNTCRFRIMTQKYTGQHFTSTHLYMTLCLKLIYFLGLYNRSLHNLIIHYTNCIQLLPYN